MTDIEEYKNIHYLEDAIPTPIKIRKGTAVVFFDDRGRNITEQETRQNMIPWIKVKYVNGRIKIPLSTRFNDYLLK